MESKDKEENGINDEEALETKNFAGLNESNLPVDSKDQEYIQTVKTWNDLKIPNELYEQLIKLSLKSPSKIQAMAITASKFGNVIAQSQNGSGKTLAFMIPGILSIDKTSVTKNEKGIPRPQVIILGDTSALIQQLSKTCSKLCEGVYDYKIAREFSGVSEIDTNPHILITTIHRLQNLIQGKTKQGTIDISNLKYQILDECDNILNSDKAKNFLPQLVLKLLPASAKMMFTTATLTEVTKKQLQKVESGNNTQRKFVTMDVPVEQLTLKNVKQVYINCQKNERFSNLDKLLKKIDASNILIFANSKDLQNKLGDHLLSQQYKVAKVMQSNENKALTAEQNQQNIEQFLAGKFRILLTTNLLSRGVDMRKVTLVINLELPRKFLEQTDASSVAPVLVDPETYLHRVGRTGRFGDHGIAINFVCDDNQKKMLKDIMEHYKHEIPELKIESFDEIQQHLKEIQSYNTQKRKQLQEDI